MTKTSLLSWGRFPYLPQIPHPCFWQEQITETLSQLTQTHQTTLAFGKGRSYGDSCLANSGHVLNTQYLDRFIATDWEKGLITAEAGVTLDQILTLTIPQGWFLPVTPGTKYVTLGGAVANDIHGKNHHVRGTFGQHIRRFGLVRSDNSFQICSPANNPALFAATVGGLGLTGIISWVELQLMPIHSSLINTTTIRFENLDEFFALSETFDRTHEYTVAWVDCLTKGSALGRGIFTAGNHAATGEIKIDEKSSYSLPIVPPFSLVNRRTLRLFNTFYYHTHKKGPIQKLSSYDPFFYPLDRIQHWNRLYGPRGFQQYQCVIPQAQAEIAIKELLQEIAASGHGSFLAVLKQCGDIPSPGLLSFPLPGTSLALDFPQHETLCKNLFPRLDKIVRESGGRLYPAKDAHMSGENFRSFYPHWTTLESLRDPGLCSHFWKRVALI